MTRLLLIAALAFALGTATVYDYWFTVEEIVVPHGQREATK